MTDYPDGYVLINLPEDSEIAVLHKAEGSEMCNRDDIKGRQKIDPLTADALLTRGEARQCRHCYPTED